MSFLANEGLAPCKSYLAAIRNMQISQVRPSNMPVLGVSHDRQQGQPNHGPSPATKYASRGRRSSSAVPGSCHSTVHRGEKGPTTRGSFFVLSSGSSVTKMWFTSQIRDALLDLGLRMTTLVTAFHLAAVYPDPSKRTVPHSPGSCPRPHRRRREFAQITEPLNYIPVYVAFIIS